jgi:biopolymer transport protein ExbD
VARDDEDKTEGQDAATAAVDEAPGELHEEHTEENPDDVLWSGGSHHLRRKPERRPMPGENIGHLNLTPMMDIMTMLLVFLVMSFATEPTNINVSLDMRPPETTSKTPMDAATKVTISKKEIIVEDKVVATVPGLDTTTQVTIAPVREALLARVDHLKAIESRGGKPFDGRLLVIADAKTPYSLVTAVLATAGESQFSEYKLVLMQKPEGGE